MRARFVCWYGPFSYDEIRNGDMQRVNGHDLSQNGVYLITGLRAYERTPAKLQYIGKASESFKGRFADKKHKLFTVKKHQKIWLGKLDSPGKATKGQLLSTEYMLIHFAEPACNDKCTIQPPDENVAIISRFYNKDGTQRTNKPKILHQLPDVLMWDKDKKKLCYCTKFQQRTP